ncbi:MAG: class III lanthionine synthetase LanKC [Actinomycetota bacterium]|nr:class III lanthionine synthetase LanKC [Actinomycetota bacterium]
MVDKRYELYCLVDPLFYDSTSRLGKQPRDFQFGHAPVPDGWVASELEDWHVQHPIDVTLPAQGWKVHISACLDNAERVLAVVADYCRNGQIAFKFRRSPEALLLANAKYANRGSSGKFITIYPADDAQLETVLTELGEALEGSPGPYVLSDLRWGNGPLYVRYGGFAQRYCLSETGSWELAIEDAEGRLVPDRRGPTFRFPEWVRLPAFLEPHLAARNSVKVDDLPYRIERALHFSNGGGLYAGRHIQTGAQVVLKEARPHAGLDVDGTDAVARLRREQEILERLDGLDVVPAVHDSFTLGEHYFLALEFVDATPLRSAIAERYPLVKPDAGERAIAEYTAWALDIQAKLERAVDSLHERGVVMGDLHPFNVLLRPDGRVVLIDFEIAAGIEEGRRQTLAAPGFAAPRDRTGFDVDRYALACLRLFLFLPLAPLMALDRAKAVDLAAVISESFPVPAPFLDEAVQVIVGSSRAGSSRPRLPLDPERDSWERIRESMAGAILASATPDRDDRLFPGDIEQFRTGGLNIAHGAAGVLYALDVTGAGRYPEYEEWLLRRAVDPVLGTTRLGFYDGLHGVAYVLDQLGQRAEALKVLDLCATELDGKWGRLGLDLHGGLAGIGLNLAHFATTTGEPALRSAAFDVAQAVADRLGDADAVGEVSGGSHPYAGLMHGSAGPALLFVRMYEQVGQPVLLDVARTALRQDLRRCRIHNDGSMEVNEGWQTMPYLADGSVGIGLVLDRYLTHRHDDQFTEAAGRIRRAARSPFYVQGGLFHGRAGMILHLGHGHPPRDHTVADHIRRLAWHAIDYQGCAAFPGEGLLRLSMDLATGTAGVLLAVGATLHSKPVHLPFLAPPQPAPARTGSATPSIRRR